LFAFAFFSVVAVLAPPTDYDALVYHLEAPKRYAQAHRYIYLPSTYSPFIFSLLVV
jgi:hypothetical protein